METGQYRKDSQSFDSGTCRPQIPNLKGGMWHKSILKHKKNNWYITSKSQGRYALQHITPQTP